MLIAWCDVAEAIDASVKRRPIVSRVIDQMVGCGTSVGANTREADEALSRADFCKCLGVVLKELGEARFWLEFVAEREWIPSRRLAVLLNEAQELSRIFNAMVARTKRAGLARGRTPATSVES